MSPHGQFKLVVPARYLHFFQLVVFITAVVNTILVGNISHGKIVCTLLQSEIIVDKSAASLFYENLPGCWGWTPKDRIYSLWCVYMIFLAYFNAGTQTS